MVQLEQAFPFSDQTPLPVGKLHYDSRFQLANFLDPQECPTLY
jgi:hypothetical protein